MQLVNAASPETHRLSKTTNPVFVDKGSICN